MYQGSNQCYRYASYFKNYFFIHPRSIPCGTHWKRLTEEAPMSTKTYALVKKQHWFVSSTSVTGTEEQLTRKA